MSIVSVSDVRTYGPGAALTDVADGVIQFYINATEKTASGYITKRGYSELTDADEDFKLAIIKLVSWDILVVHRGVNPADPAHAALKDATDAARKWFTVDVAGGEANIQSATPARVESRTARVFRSGSSTEPRGF